MQHHYRTARPMTAGAFSTVAALVLASTACARTVSTRPEPEGEAEEVNVGYGSRDRDNLTGAVSSVTGDELDRHAASSMEQVLRGRVPGLQVVRRGGELSIAVRGLRGFREPHVVIDGAPSTARDLLRLTPNVVARIDVLKDAGAAVYGLRGANGVILVTTRRGTR